MARLIPNISVEAITNKPERDVARALVDQLPAPVTVYHSYPWLRADRNDYSGKSTLHQGEADFLLLSPELGLLVLEVKGGEIHYDSNDRGWYRRLAGGRRRGIKDPFEQANRNMYRVIDGISNDVYRGDRPGFSFGYAVVFPDCDYTGDPPPGAHPSIILDARDLPRIGDRVRKAFKQWSRIDPPKTIAGEELARVKRAILPRFNLYPVLGRTIEAQEEQLIRLTEEQIGLLKFLGAHQRVAIEGVAGSGKTLMAKAQAERFADKGKRTLFLCYNKTLAEWLRRALAEEHRGLIEVVHFHKLCHDWCQRAGVAFEPPERHRNGFWQHEAAELLWEAIDGLPDRYDAVVVDEGQDFHADWWDAIEALDADGEQGCLYVFYDPAQNLYNDDGVSIPSLGAPYRLQTNCRNTQAIARTCGDILDRDIATPPGAPAGIQTEVVAAHDHRETIQTLTHWLKDWVNRDRIAPSQIAILSPFTQARSSLDGQSRLSGIPLTDSLDEWQANKGVLFSTIRSFKGLEADIVVLVDVVELGSIAVFSQSDFYVACSRAKHVLKIVSDIPEERLFDDRDQSR